MTIRWTKTKNLFALLFVIGCCSLCCGDDRESGNPPKKAIATFGAGCFWCVEAVFEELDGVIAVESGFAGGKVKNPTYKQVLSGRTGHAEVCQIHYNPAKIRYEELLEVFWKTHDPTTRNRQGVDVGTQYRSIILYHDDQQKELAEKYKEKLNAAKIWRGPIVTQIRPYMQFYSAEKYHQDYFKLNPNQRYCVLMIQPKMAKFREVFKDKLKKPELREQFR